MPNGFEALQERMVGFFRAFGLPQADQTPCGQTLSVSEAHALMELEPEHGLAQTELAARLRLEKSTISRLVTQLERRGWLDRQRSPRDGRVVLLRLTAQGQRVKEKVALARADKYARIFERLPEQEREAVLRALEALADAAEEHQSNEGEGP